MTKGWTLDLASISEEVGAEASNETAKPSRPLDHTPDEPRLWREVSYYYRDMLLDKHDLGQCWDAAYLKKLCRVLHQFQKRCYAVLRAAIRDADLDRALRVWERLLRIRKRYERLLHDNTHSPPGTPTPTRDEDAFMRGVEYWVTIFREDLAMGRSDNTLSDLRQNIELQREQLEAKFYALREVAEKEGAPQRMQKIRQLLGEARLEIWRICDSFE